MTDANATTTGLSIQRFTSSEAGAWSNSYLVGNGSEAILFDVPMLRSDAGKLAEMIVTSGKTVMMIVVNHKFHYIAKALDYLPADTVLDGELVAMGLDGKPNFNLLQNCRRE